MEVDSFIKLSFKIRVSHLIENCYINFINNVMKQSDLHQVEIKL